MYRESLDKVMTTNDIEDLKKFLTTFPAERLGGMTIEEYTGTDNNKGFTYWVERKLDAFGGIKNAPAYKFGIYKYKNEPTGNSYPKDENYTWVKKYGETRVDAFNNIIGEIVKVVRAVQQDQIAYTDIEDAKLSDTYKWKIAYLYSWERNGEELSQPRLISVYKKEALITAAKRLGALPSKNDPTIADLQQALVEYYKNNCKNESYNDMRSFGIYVWKIGNTDLSQSNQIIKYGAPGTGKTYSVEIEAKEFFELWQLEAQNNTEEFKKHYEFVQFHPSYSYEDFIEGIKPVMTESGNTELRLKNGIFKAFCKKAANYELWLLEKKILKPDDKENGKLGNIKVKHVIDFDIKPFTFPDNVNLEDPIKKYIPPYFFIIDEINRADLSRVFGELMYCLEYRGYEGKIKTQYAELEREKDDTVFYKEADDNYFFIPENVRIIGTMNTIDRSIESFDFALRRRFLWQRVEPSKKVLQEYFEEKKETELGDFLIPIWEALNTAIAQHPLLGEDYEIGHSYLMKLDQYTDFDKPSTYRDIIWKKHILPILEEYFRGMGREAKEQIDKLKSKF